MTVGASLVVLAPVSLLATLLISLLAIECVRLDRAQVATQRSLTAISVAYAQADDEWLTAVAKERAAAQANPSGS